MKDSNSLPSTPLPGDNASYPLGGKDALGPAFQTVKVEPRQSQGGNANTTASVSTPKS